MISTLHTMGPPLRRRLPLRYHYTCSTSLSLLLYILICPIPSTHHGQPGVRTAGMEPKLQKDSCVSPAVQSLRQKHREAKGTQWCG